MTHVVNNNSHFAPRRCVVCAFLLLIAHVLLQAAEPASTAVAQPPDAHVRALTDLLAAEKQILKERSEQIQQLFKKIADDLKELEPQGGAPPTPEEARKRERLVSQRSTLQAELNFLEQARKARQSAIDAEHMATLYRRALELFKRRAAESFVYHGPAEIAAIKAQIEQARSLLATIDKMDAGRQERLTEVKASLEKKESGQNSSLLDAERRFLLAQIDSTAESRRSQQAQIDLQQAKLSVASPSTASTMSQSAPTTGPAVDQKVAENKQRLAKLMEEEAQNGRVRAQRKLDEVSDRISVAAARKEDSRSLEDDVEYWEQQLNYENRRLRQADAAKRIAVEKQQIADLQASIDDQSKILGELGKTYDHYSLPQRKTMADAYRQKAVETRKNAETTYKRIDREQPNSDLWSALLHTIDTIQDSVVERRAREFNFRHHDRMIPLLDAERQQVDSLQNSSDVIKFAYLNESTLHNKLASLYERCADTLVPPEPGFWEKNRKIIRSIVIVLASAGISYFVKFLIWLTQRSIRALNAQAPGRFSPKRAETLLSFFGGIIRLFIWIFAVIFVLNQFDIDPARTTGIIGLVSLVLAGMFQQIVIDFVKGFDILSGRHYNVGDFVELDGKTGHVIDFSVKHTRIRTPSGQEYNLPNSKCIPSRRFPDGYVDNYVDIPLRSSGDLQRAKRAIALVCRHLSRRIEHVKDEPIFVDQFPGTRPSSVIVRYRVRILPASNWVITEQFIPDVMAALAEEGIELVEEPTFFFINRIQVFRRLFSRELTEGEILQEAKEQQRPTVERTDSSEESAAPAPKHVDAEPVLTG